MFEVAAQGDAVATEIIRWAGQELGELAKAVIRQLHFEALDFDVVLLGSMFNGGSLPIDPMRETIHELAPGARLVRLNAPPVVGAVLLGMEQAHYAPTPSIRAMLTRTVTAIRAMQAETEREAAINSDDRLRSLLNAIHTTATNNVRRSTFSRRNRKSHKTICCMTQQIVFIV